VVSLLGKAIFRKGCRRVPEMMTNGVAKTESVVSVVGAGWMQVGRGEVGCRWRQGCALYTWKGVSERAALDDQALCRQQENM
jgi:hypothetical protein